MCIPGSVSSIPQTNVTCSDHDLDEELCGNLPCPKEHCPIGFEFSVG